MVFLLLVDNKTSAATRKFHLVFHKSMYILDGVEQCGVYSWTEIKLKVAGSVRLGYSHIGGPQASPYQDAFHNDWQRTLVCTDARCVCIFFNVFDRKRPVASCYRPGSVHRRATASYPSIDAASLVSRELPRASSASQQAHAAIPPSLFSFVPVIHRTIRTTTRCPPCTHSRAIAPRTTQPPHGRRGPCARTRTPRETTRPAVRSTCLYGYIGPA